MSPRDEGKRRGYNAAVEANEFLFLEHFDGDEDEYLDAFFEAAVEAEFDLRDMNGISIDEDEYEDYETGVRLGIKKRWEEVMGLFQEGE